MSLDVSPSKLSAALQDPARKAYFNERYSIAKRNEHNALVSKIKESRQKSKDAAKSLTKVIPPININKSRASMSTTLAGGFLNTSNKLASAGFA